MEKIYLSLGSNVGDRGDNLKSALVLLEKWGIKIVRSSSIYETEPLGFKDQDWFYNLVVEGLTDFSPEELLKIIKSVEDVLKRERIIKNGPRTIDIDIILYGNIIVDKAGLKIPHERMHLRRFVLIPLDEIAYDVVHPIFKKTARELLKECEDTAIVRPL